ncbi:MAG: KGK domain-containing protein [Coleofasciculaceae cyanobacterium]
MDDKFKPLESQEVLSLEEDNKILLPQLMFTPGQLIAHMKFILARHAGNRTNENLEKWLDEGVDCATLKFGSEGWQKGKVRFKISVEFCPEEPEIAETPQPDSPLDDLRQMINKETQQ